MTQAKAQLSATLRALCALLVAGLLSACASDDSGELAKVEFERPDTFIEYDISLEGVEDEEVRGLLEQALELYRRQDGGANSIAFLRRRARGDVQTAQKVLRSFGWYAAEVDVKVVRPEDRTDLEPDEEEEAAQSNTPPAEGEEAPPPRALARMIITPNPRYELVGHEFILVETGPGAPPAQPDASALGSPVGEPAVARRILRAEDAAVSAFQSDGRVYARRLGRDAVIDPETAEMEVATTISTGRAYVMGPVTFIGADGVEREYLETYISFKEGDKADPAVLTQFQRDLVETNLFDAAAATFPEEAPPGPEAPVTVRLEERAPRTVSAGVRYDTDIGPAVRGGYEHRNLFGSNETLTLSALIGLEEQSVNGTYTIPQWLRPNQDLIYGLELRHLDNDAFEELGATATVGVERELSDTLTVGYGVLGEISEVTDSDGERISRLLGLPTFVDYDTSDDELDPSKGYRVFINATPFGGRVGDTPAAFMIVDGTASTYFDLLGDKKYILASRARLGSALAGDFDVVAANRRLYSGGGGSVRGYEERQIGPLDDDGDPTGGLSVVELGAELRARVSDVIGVAGFIEAGAVSRDLAPTLDEGVQVAAGGGVRYFSPIGPLRVDVGVPVNPREDDASFQIYISIGQAF